jgi:hypothetical protein
VLDPLLLLLLMRQLTKQLLKSTEVRPADGPLMRLAAAALAGPSDMSS